MLVVKRKTEINEYLILFPCGILLNEQVSNFLSVNSNAITPEMKLSPHCFYIFFSLFPKSLFNINVLLV